jgi:uncharacterized protein involved in outer membrane biogenesis
MKKKWILGSLAGFVAALIVLLVVVAFSLGTIVKKGVETVGPRATRVAVTLKNAEVWLLAWRIQLTDFVLGNPAGCRTPSAIDVGTVSVQFKPGSVFSDKLVVDSIKVKSPLITLEGGLTDNNLQKIEKNLNDYIGSSSTTPQTTAPASSPVKQEKKLQVNDLVISGAKLQVNTMLSADRTITLPIPDIHLTDLGDGPQGITAAEVAQRALHAILIAATKEVAQNASQLGKEALSGGKNAVKNTTDSLKGLFH